MDRSKVTQASLHLGDMTDHRVREAFLGWEGVTKRTSVHEDKREWQNLVSLERGPAARVSDPLASHTWSIILGRGGLH